MSNINKVFEVSFQSNVIYNVSEYKYLGNVVDATITPGNDFDMKNIAKLQTGLQLIRKLRPCVTKTALLMIYNFMIVSSLTYCGIIHLNGNRRQQSKYKSIERSSTRVVGTKRVPSDRQKSEHHCGTLCSNFNNCVLLNIHDKLTSNENFLLKLPKVRNLSSEVKRKFRFYFLWINYITFMTTDLCIYSINIHKLIHSSWMHLPYR